MLPSLKAHESNSASVSFSNSSTLKNLPTERTISNFHAFTQLNGANTTKLTALQPHLEHYFSTGGVLRLKTNTENEWMIVYPTKDRLKVLMDHKNQLKNTYVTKLNVWKRKLSETERELVLNTFKQFSNPLYWKHMRKYLTDKDYKQKADAVKLPLHLVNEPRWQPMIKMFVHDEEYRKQLTETVQESIVYSQDRKVARYASQVHHFRKTESQRNLEHLSKKITELEEDLAALHAIMKLTIL